MVPSANQEGRVADKKALAKKAGIFVGVKKTIGMVSKLAVVAGIGAAVVKILRGDKATAT